MPIWRIGGWIVPGGLSAADPEPASSSLSELSAKVKMVLPIHRLIIGLFAW